MPVSRPSSSSTPAPGPELVDSNQGLAELVESLAGMPAVAIDCEMDAMFAYRTSLCLLQLGWEGGEALVDAMADLDWTVLDRLFDDEGMLKILHGGENDIGLMAAHWGLSFRNIFDTSAAAQVVGRERVGLAALLDEHFDVKASKQHQRADWRVRPLAPELADYAREDVRYLIPLYRLLQAELEQLDRVEEAHSEFNRIRRAHLEDKPFEPDAWVRIKGARELPVKRRGMLAEVFAARDTIACRLDRAPYRVARDYVLLELARRMPRTLPQLQRIKGLARDLGEDDLTGLLAAVRKGADVQELKLPSVPRRGGYRPPNTLTPEQQQLFDRLRSWRARRAKQRGVMVARVATNVLLAAIARARPASADELARVEGMESWRMREYADDMLAVVRGESP